MIFKYSLLLPTGHVHDLFGFSFCFYALSNFQPSFVTQYIDKFKYSNSVGILPSSHFLDILDKAIHISLPPSPHFIQSLLNTAFSGTFNLLPHLICYIYRNRPFGSIRNYFHLCPVTFKCSGNYW